LVRGKLAQHSKIAKRKLAGQSLRIRDPERVGVQLCCRRIAALQHGVLWLKRCMPKCTPTAASLLLPEAGEPFKAAHFSSLCASPLFCPARSMPLSPGFLLKLINKHIGKLMNRHRNRLQTRSRLARRLR